jgi:hypothetical protein
MKVPARRLRLLLLGSLGAVAVIGLTTVSGGCGLPPLMLGALLELQAAVCGPHRYELGRIELHGQHSATLDVALTRQYTSLQFSTVPPTISEWTSEQFAQDLRVEGYISVTHGEYVAVRAIARRDDGGIEPMEVGLVAHGGDEIRFYRGDISRLTLVFDSAVDHGDVTIRLRIVGTDSPLPRNGLIVVSGWRGGGTDTL